MFVSCETGKQMEKKKSEKKELDEIPSQTVAALWFSKLPY